MKIGADGGLGHLTYCTNIHPGETWPEVRQALANNLPEIKSRISPDAPFGVGLRLGAEAVHTLGQSEALAELQTLLGEDLYVFTLNGFPYGRFHAAPVKQQVYQPDWRDPARLAYTNLLADVLADLLPENMPGSISTLPGTYRPWLEQSTNPALYRTGISQNLLRHVAHLDQLQKNTGKTIRLALEPEPFCLLERSTEVVDFFANHLLNQTVRQFLCDLAGCSMAQSESIIRRHLGVCLDVCHQSVVFEDPLAAVRNYQTAGIQIAKCQLSTALRINPANQAQRTALAAFDDAVYLHQTYIQQNGDIKSYSDLGLALAATKDDLPAEWRCHFHVPVFLAQLENFQTTQADLVALLQQHKADPIADHLEVETYTWDVLPAQYRNSLVSEAIVRELNWVKGQLA